MLLIPLVPPLNEPLTQCTSKRSKVGTGYRELGFAACSPSCLFPAWDSAFSDLRWFAAPDLWSKRAPAQPKPKVD